MVGRDLDVFRALARGHRRRGMTRCRTGVGVATSVLAAIVAGGCGASSAPSSSTTGNHSKRPATATRAPSRSPQQSATASPQQSATASVDATSLKSVAAEWNRLNASLDAGDAKLRQAWEFVDPECRPASVYRQTVKLHETIVKPIRDGLAKATPAQRAAAERRMKGAGGRPKMVIYDGGEQSGRKPIDTTPDEGATGAAVFSYDGQQVVGVTRFIRRSGKWWVDLRTGPTDAGTTLLYARRYQCPS
jgi:hypothetical protein